MQFDTKEFKKIIDTVKPGLAQKQLVPGMTRFIFTGEHIVTYNGEECIHFPLDTDFKCSVNADKFSKTINRVKPDTMDLSIAGNVLTLSAGRLNAEFSIDAEIDVVQSVIKQIVDEIENAGDDEWKGLPETFTEAIRLTSFAASTDKTKQTQCCVHALENYIMAADIHSGKVAFYTLPFQIDPFMINAKESISVINSKIGMFCITKAWVHFATEEGVIFSIRKIEGGFQYDRLFQYRDSFSNPVQVKLPDDVSEAIETAGIFPEDEEFPITVKVEQNKMLFIGKSASGSASYEADTEYAGQGMTFKISSALISHILGVTHTMTVDGSRRKALFQAGNFSYVMSMGEISQ